MGAIDKFLNVIKMNEPEDEYYDDDYLDDEEMEAPAKSSRKSNKNIDEDNKKGLPKVTAINRKKTNYSGMEVYGIKPTSMEDAKEITDTLLDNKTVVLNLEGLDIDIARRILDFAMGSVYAINGTIQKISDTIFIIVPSTVDISGVFQDIIGS